MKIDANDKQIQDIFASGYFKIPRFQRPYSWGEDEIENFWSDIVLDKTDSYFIGSMVVYQTNKPYFGIVDGQQRLTTITIMLAVIRDSFEFLKEENLAKGTHKFIEMPNINYENEFILDAETSYPFLHNQIQEFSSGNAKIDIKCDVGFEELNLKVAYDILLKRTAEFIGVSSKSNDGFDLFKEEQVSKLTMLRNKILSLKLVFIQLDSEDDAYLIFETLNARGRDLRTSDLVKNLILKKSKAKNVSIDAPKELWIGMLKRFDNVSDSNVIDSFLLHYWISKQKYCTDKQLFPNIKEFILKDEENTTYLLSNLDELSNYYCRMLNPETFQWKKEQNLIKDALVSLNIFKVKQQSSFILSLLSSYFTNIVSMRQIKSIIVKIVHFHFVFNAVTQQRSSGSISSIYSRHAIELSKAETNDDIQKTLNSLTKSLHNKLPSYDEFEVKFVGLCYLSNKTKSKSLIKYILSKLLGSESACLDIKHDTLTIEHLIPEAEIKNGTKCDLVGNIGNLILIDSKTNESKLGNKNIKEKMEILRENNYPMKTAFIDIDSEWNSESVLERSKKMSNSIYYSVKLN